LFNYVHPIYITNSYFSVTKVSDIIFDDTYSMFAVSVSRHRLRF